MNGRFAVGIDLMLFLTHWPLLVKSFLHFTAYVALCLKTFCLTQVPVGVCIVNI